MILSLAPMEGLTGHVFRKVHAECFGPLDRYYTPFLAPPRVGSSFGKRMLVELDPKNNEGLAVVPQLLTKNADEFVWAAQLLAKMGYGEVNLNLGCPSGTVVAKGKGAGFLRDLEELDAFWGRSAAGLPSRYRSRRGSAFPKTGSMRRSSRCIARILSQSSSSIPVCRRTATRAPHVGSHTA